MQNAGHREPRISECVLDDPFTRRLPAIAGRLEDADDQASAKRRGCSIELEAEDARVVAAGDRPRGSAKGELRAMEGFAQVGEQGVIRWV
jgi:hypothetical protein